MPSEEGASAPTLVHNCKGAPCYVCGSEDGSGNVLPERIEATLTWSDPDARYLGSAGETTALLTPSELITLIRDGLRDGEGNVVTTLTIWPNTGLG